MTTQTAATISDLQWDDGTDATDRGWWFRRADGLMCMVESGTLTADSDRSRVLRAVADKLGVDRVVEAREITDAQIIDHGRRQPSDGANDGGDHGTAPRRRRPLWLRRRGTPCAQ
jgi:hypothetical protein